VLFFSQPKNLGIVAALNQGLEMTRGKYIARLDADDLSLANRIEVQFQELELNPNIGLIGSASRLINSKGKVIGSQSVETGSLALQWNLLFHNPFIHSTIVFRKELLEKILPYYSSDFPFTEDYELWTRLAPLTRFENINIPLIDSRVHMLSISAINKKIQLEGQIKISIKNIRSTLPEIKLTDSEIMNLCVSVKGIGDTHFYQTERVVAASAFLDLWSCFSRHFQSNSEIPTIEHSILSKTARMVLFPPFQSDTLKIVRRLNNSDRNWPWYFVRSVPSSIKYIIQNKFSGQKIVDLISTRN
jgi:glycosyltransferase involved in cell wall biosynthesis